MTAEAGPAAGPGPGPDAGTPPRFGAAPRILVAEDNPMNRQVAGSMLGTLGCAPDFAVDGVEAVEKERERAYDLVLLDLHMPRMDGLEAARRILARHGAGTRPRIVAVTASVLHEDRAACEAAGMDGFLAKPIRMAELRAVVEGARPGGSVPAPAPVTGVLDPASLASILDIGGEELLVSLFGHYLDGAPELGRRILEGLDRGDAKEVEDAAHKLRGSALNFGARRLAAVTQAMEAGAGSGGVAAAAPHRGEFEAALAETEAAVSSRLASG